MLPRQSIGATLHSAAIGDGQGQAFLLSWPQGQLSYYKEQGAGPREGIFTLPKEP